jgi:hypothetical protein
MIDFIQKGGQARGQAWRQISVKVVESFVVLAQW